MLGIRPIQGDLRAVILELGMYIDDGSELKMRCLCLPKALEILIDDRGFQIVPNTRSDKV